MDEREYSKVVANNLKRIMYENGKTQADMAKDLRISKATLSSWMNGTRTPKMPKIDMLCNYFNVTRADIMEPRTGQPTSTAVRIPVYGNVAAGIPLEMITDILDWEEIPSAMARCGEYFSLRIHGDSMEPKMSEGDVVIVRRQPDAESGDIVIATVNGDSATCKRLRKHRDGVELVPLNPSYPPLFYTDEEVVNKPVTILGKVVELRAKF